MMLERKEKTHNNYNFSDLVTQLRELKVVIRNTRTDKINTWALDVSENSFRVVTDDGADGFYVEVLP